MRKMTEPEARAFLAEPARTATFSTVRPDGRPHAVPVWFTPDGDGFAFTTWHAAAKVRNMRANPNVVLTVQNDQPPYDYVNVEGTAEVLDDLAECLRIATILGGRYMGTERAEEFGARNGVEGELVVRIRPSSIRGVADVAG
jgi:PPOX class probable F420-dependent enzyme